MNDKLHQRNFVNDDLLLFSGHFLFKKILFVCRPFRECQENNLI